MCIAPRGLGVILDLEGVTKEDGVETVVPQHTVVCPKLAREGGVGTLLVPLGSLVKGP